MKREAHPAEVERFRAAITARLGLQFDDAKFGFLADVLRRRSEAAGQEAAVYVGELQARSVPEEVRELARELTVAETYFFRDIDQFSAVRDIVVPERLARRVDGRLAILSLGCASGEEPFSLAMLVTDLLGAGARSVEITGIDANPAAIERARHGRFSAWALRATPDEDRRRWFRRDGRDFVLDEALRAAVRLEQRNIVDDDAGFWRADCYDLIFCRNVLMYFAPEQARLVVRRIACALRPGGYLFLGHAETLRGLSTDFELRHTHGSFYYQRKADLASAQPSAADARSLPSAVLADAAGEAESWVDAIHRASARVDVLTHRGRSPAERRRPALATARPVWDLTRVVELMRGERFAEALAVIDGLPAASDRDVDVILMRAVLLTHGGHFDRAAAACRRLLELDGLSAGAHYLLALCHEAAGEAAAARYHDQVAVYLDPGFAMPRLHLGLLARRAGQAAAARRELGQALVLLQREDASRVLLYGGGFGREALVALCDAELARCGGRP